MKTFEELGLSDEFIGNLSNLKIKIPTEIQEKTIPLVLAGRDVIGGSATGSGKTLAFASSIVENLQKNGRVQGLVLTPTRELAEQVSISIRKFSKHAGLNVLPVYGGVNIYDQIRLIRNTDIIVGTPGRILDHLGRGTLNLGKVKFLVLDEVDRMFDMGFQKDVETILEECPKKRQTMLFSATISSDMNYLSQKYTQKPAEISVKSHIEPAKLKQIFYDVPDGMKFSLFVHLLKKEKSNLVMVFCGTRHNVDFVNDNLNNLGIDAKAIHGGMIQNKRNRVMNEFNSKKGVSVLVCTDVAARGLDIKGVSHVYNYDLPKTSGDYIHRIGRTARAGREGIAVNILCSRDYENFSNILRDEKLKIEQVNPPFVERVKIVINERKGFGSRSRDSGFGRGRSSGRDSGFSRGRSSGRSEGGKSYGGRSSGRDNSRQDSRRSGSFGRGRSSGRDSNFSKGRSDGPRRNSSRDSGFSRGRSSGRDNSRQDSRRSGSRDNRNNSSRGNRDSRRKRTYR